MVRARSYDLRNREFELVRRSSFCAVPMHCNRHEGAHLKPRCPTQSPEKAPRIFGAREEARPMRGRRAKFTASTLCPSEHRIVHMCRFTITTIVRRDHEKCKPQMRRVGLTWLPIAGKCHFSYPHSWPGKRLPNGVLSEQPIRTDLGLPIGTAHTHRLGATQRQSPLHLAPKNAYFSQCVTRSAERWNSGILSVG